jgi:BCD family chlorophyll transporter-like MFS transporter
MTTGLSWIAIVRLGLVQTALGAIVVFSTSTLNRVMVVELSLPAMLPGALVAVHYGAQVLRPRLGHGSDANGRRTPWIIGGMSVLATGGVMAAAATGLMAAHLVPGLALAIVAFLLIGVGVGATGTTLLVLLATHVDPSQRAAAATVVWVMMIAGFVATAAGAGSLLDPFSPLRLFVVATGVASAATVLTVLAVHGLEGPATPQPADARSRTPFAAAWSQVSSEPLVRRFAVFVFVSMLAYGAEELLVEPFAGTVFGFTPGQSSKLSGVQHGGVLVGMLLVGGAGAIGGRRAGPLPAWTIAGCIASAAALVSLAAAGLTGSSWPLLRTTVFVLGVANGVYAVAAIGSMMALVGAGQEAHAGVRMGLWGAAQAIAFGLGGLAGTLESDLLRFVMSKPASAYAAVFASQAALFVVAAMMVMRMGAACGNDVAHQRAETRSIWPAADRIGAG